MQLTSLSLHNFRSYTQEYFELTTDKIILCGDNGRGKTNVLEAITLLSVGKSWRETAATDLIQKGHPSALIKAKTHQSDIFEVAVLPRARRFRKNEKPLTRTKYFGQIPTLLFCPEFLDLFSGPKKARQAFFDRFLVQVSPLFRESLQKANKAHTSKNRLLKEGDNQPFDYLSAQIDPWDQILASTLPLIFEERARLAKELTPFIETALSEISGADQSAMLQTNLKEEFEITSQGISDFLKQSQSRSRAARKNFCHPGTQDFEFLLRDQPVQSTASRGEMRSVVLALLAAQKNFMRAFQNQSPILLLDDVFSELDDYRQAHLESICDGCQTFFTTTHENHFQKFKQNCQIISC